MASNPFQAAMELYEKSLAKADRRMDNWLFMGTPVPSVVFILMYFIMIYAGMQIMKNRKPLQIRWLIVPYNLFIILFCAYISKELLVSAYLSRYRMICQPVDESTSPLALRMANALWLFYVSKLIEIFDTLFFVLRKKNSHVSFLHVYHHASTIFNWWIGARFVPGGSSWFSAFLNSLVHVFMYTYYGLSALGPKIQKYLWWKRYLTQLQLLQFVLIMVHMGLTIYQDCGYSRPLGLLCMSHTLSLFVLFVYFYIGAYKQQPMKMAAESTTNGTMTSHQLNNHQVQTNNHKKKLV